MHDIHLPTFEFDVPDSVCYDSPAVVHESYELRLMQLTFGNIPLRVQQISQWYEAITEQVISKSEYLKNTELLLFGGLDTNSTLHQPALVQYRCNDGKAALWGMNEGADAILQLYFNLPEEIALDSRVFSTGKVEMMRGVFPVVISDNWEYYRVDNYILDAVDFTKWVNSSNLIERVGVIESALTGHLLKLCSEFGLHLSDYLKVEIVEIHGQQLVKQNQNLLTAIGLSYRCNLIIPETVALGRATYLGFGVQWKVCRRN